MALADCFTPTQVIDCLFSQIDKDSLPVPVEEIASAVGIEEIARVVTDEFEGALIPNTEKSRGIIALRADSNPRRQRFTIGHELGHFLIPTHKPRHYRCRAEDIDQGATQSDNSPKEREANCFSADLLIPEDVFRKKIQGMGEPEISEIRSITDRFDVSIEAGLRRFVDLADYGCCLIFSKNRIILYPYWGKDFPFLCVRKNDSLPEGAVTANRDLPRSSLTDVEEVDSYWWLDTNTRNNLPSMLQEQTLYQADGLRVTLLWFDEDLEDDEEEGPEYELPRFR